MAYLPCILFRAKCFAETPVAVIFQKHYEAIWENKPFKTSKGAINFARKQIEHDSDMWQLPSSKLVEE